MDQTTSQHPKLKYFKVEKFEDEKGCVLTVKTPKSDGWATIPMNNAKLEDVFILENVGLDTGEQPKISGVFMASVQTQYGPVKQQYEFPFPDGMSIIDCFSNYQETAEEAFNKLKTKVEDKSRIVVPGHQKGGLII